MTKLSVIKILAFILVSFLSGACERNGAASSLDTTGKKEYIRIQNFGERFADADFGYCRPFFSQEVQTYGYFGLLAAKDASQWISLSGNEVLDAYKKLHAADPVKWSALEESEPEVVVARHYTRFPKKMPRGTIKDDDIVLDFNLSESVFGEKRVVFDEAPVFVFRNLGERWQLVAQIVFLGK